MRTRWDYVTPYGQGRLFMWQNMKYVMYNLERPVDMQEHEIILYQLEDTNIYVNVIFKDETF